MGEEEYSDSDETEKEGFRCVGDGEGVKWIQGKEIAWVGWRLLKQRDWDMDDADELAEKLAAMQGVE